MVHMRGGKCAWSVLKRRVWTRGLGDSGWAGKQGHARAFAHGNMEVLGKH